MGYELRYDLQSIKISKNKKHSGHLHFVALTAFLILCTVMMHFGGTVLQTVILGQRETAKAAAEHMVEDIRSGTSLTDAIQTFCAELAE